MIQKKTTLIALAYNKLEETTKPFLRSLYAHTDAAAFDLVFVDNASSDGTAEYLRAFAETKPNVRLILNKKNNGFSGGNNDGLKLVETAYTVYVNNDVFFTPAWLDALVKPLEDERVGLAGPITNYGHSSQMVNIPGVNKENYLEKYSAVLQNKLEETDILGGFCIAARTDFLRALGGFDEAFNPVFYEDDDLSLRSGYAGKKNIINRNVYLYHNATSTTRAISGARMRKINAKNKTYFNQKHYAYVMSKRKADLERKYGKNLLSAFLVPADKFLFNLKGKTRFRRRKITDIFKRNG